jgi:galactose oxidase
MLGDGSVYTQGGSWNGGLGGKNGEVWDINTGIWSLKPGIIDDASFHTQDVAGIFRSDNHYWLFTSPSGKVFHAGPGKQMHWIDTTGNGSVILSVLRGDDDHSMAGNAVMFDVGKILTLGGSPNSNAGSAASKRSYVVDINDSTNAIVTRQADMKFARTYVSSVVLPNGSVVTIGGIPIGTHYSELNAANNAEIWSPTTGLWTTFARMKNARVYHSFAILMKDGRVLAGGGGVCGSCAVNHPDVEIFTPPYLVNPVTGLLKTRPVISSAPTTINRTLSFVVQMADTRPYTFSLVKLSAATHFVNTDQRRLPLTAVSSGNGSFTVTTNPNPNVTLPGPYFLFAMDAGGTPSIGFTLTVSI